MQANDQLRQDGMIKDKTRQLKQITVLLSVYVGRNTVQYHTDLNVRSKISF